MARQRLRIHLSLSPDELLRYYRAEVEWVIAYTPDRISVQFPVEALRRHVTQDGIYGWFEIEFDERNKFLGLYRMSG